jgi:hypothetical protein
MPPHISRLLLVLLIGLGSIVVSPSWIIPQGVVVREKSSLLTQTQRPDGEEEDAVFGVDILRRKAEQLRREVQQLESAKQAAKMEQSKREQQIQAEQDDRRNRYSVMVPILKPDGTTVVERCHFQPRNNNNNNNSFLMTIESPLPLGILLGECDDGFISIDEVAEGSHGSKAGLQPNDLVRAITACKMEMELPTWQLMAGGIGIPKTKRFLYSVDHKPLEEVMAAVASNRMDPNGRPMLLVIERVMQQDG